MSLKLSIQTLNGVSSKGSFIKPVGDCEMLYKFKSKAAGDLIMLGEHAEPLLRVLGKEVGPKGILLSSDLGRSIELLEKAIAEHGAEPSANTDRSQGDQQAEKEAPHSSVSFGVRAQPMLSMMRHALREEADIVWGV